MNIYEVLVNIKDKMVENKDFLTELDREIGDADHGINMARGFEAVIENLDANNSDIGDVLKQTGMILLSNVGGASGPLYGTVFMKAGAKAKGKTSVDLELLLEMLEAAIAGIKKRGKSEVKEKTMLDAIVPAYEAMKVSAETSSDLAAAMEKAYEAAKSGVEYTKTIKATKGRASYLGDRSIGHQDPGATSAMLMFEVLNKAFA